MRSPRLGSLGFASPQRPIDIFDDETFRLTD
jgi:hypothetical protein